MRRQKKSIVLCAKPRDTARVQIATTITAGDVDYSKWQGILYICYITLQQTKEYIQFYYK